MKKKVLLVATVQSHIAQFHRPLANLLHEHGYEVHVAAKNNLAEKNGLQIDFADKIHDLPFSRSPKSKDNYYAYKQLKKILDAEKYDVVHCNTPMGGIVTRLAARATRKKGTQVIYTAHGFHFYKGGPLKSWICYYPIEKLFSRLTDILITITHEDYALASKKFHCKVEHMHGVGVDENRYFPIDKNQKKILRQKMGFADEQKIILCIGELNENKNQSVAIRMMTQIKERYPDALLLLAGNGPKQHFLEELIAELGLQNSVKLLGYVTNLQDYQHIIDIQVCCSKREGLPLNVVESMLSGNAIVATYNRGHRELIRNGENGYLVPQNAPNAMADKVLTLLENENLKSKMETAAHVFATKYGFSSITKELAKIYGL